MKIKNKYNREWEELDSIRAQAFIPKSFTLVSEDGIPLCGQRVDGIKPEKYIAKDWKSCP